MLHKKQVQQIREDLHQDGVRSEALLDDLLDHLCTGIEEEMAQGKDFDTAYEQLWQNMIPGGAREIQQATDFLLTFKQFIIMRKLLFISGFVWAFVTLMGILFNILHYPGAYALIQTSGLLLGVVLIPVFIIFRIRDQHPKGLFEKTTYVVGVLTSLLVTLACVFKLMHLAGANILLISSLFTLACIFLPLLFVLWYRQERRQETA